MASSDADAWFVRTGEVRRRTLPCSEFRLWWPETLGRVGAACSRCGLETGGRLSLWSRVAGVGSAVLCADSDLRARELLSDSCL